MKNLEKFMEEWQGESFWRAEPGEFLIGHYEGVEQIQGQFGPQNVLKLSDADGTLWKVRMTAVLQNLLNERKPVIGQRIGVKYFGRPGRYHKWGVILDEDVPDFKPPAGV